MHNTPAMTSNRPSKSGKLAALCAAAALCALAATSASAAPTLVNGSLTGDATSGEGNVPPGWTVIAPTPDTNDTTHVLAGYSPYFSHTVPASDSPDGGTWVGYGGFGTESERFGQTVNGFTIGNSYTLTWYHAVFGLTTTLPGNPIISSFTSSGAIEVLADGESIGTGALRAMGPGWVEESITFVAKEVEIDLTFTGFAGDADFFYQSIDGIRLTDASPSTAVPEPASLSLFGAGALLLAARRRKQAAKAA